MAIIDQLKEKVKENERLVANSWHFVTKKEVKLAEGKKAKKEMSKAYRDRVTAKQLYRAKRKLSSYPSQTRQYAKKHMDKVFKLLENSK